MSFIYSSLGLKNVIASMMEMNVVGGEIGHDVVFLHSPDS